MNDPTDLPFDRIPLNGTATLPGPRTSLDDLLAGSALLPPTRSPVAVAPPKPAAEPPKPAEATAPPEPRWVKEAVVNLFTPSRKKVLVLSSAAALAAGAMAVNVLFSGKDRTPPTAPTHEETVSAVVPPTPAPTPPDPTPPGSIPAVGVPTVPPVGVPIPTPAPPTGYQPLATGNEVVIPPLVVVPPLATPAGGPIIPHVPPPAEVVVPTPTIITAGASDPVPPPTIPNLPSPTGPVVPTAPTIPAAAPTQQGTGPGTAVPAPVAVPNIPLTPTGTGPSVPSPFGPPMETSGGAAANLKFGPQDVPGSFALTKPSDPPVRSAEPARTDFDLDLHEPKAGDTYATISKLHYGDAKYADALRAFNRNAELGRTAVDVPPMYVLRKRYTQLIGRPAGTETGRDRTVDWGPSSK